MLYPNLSININKKRQGLEDGGAQLINTPVILDRILDLEEQKERSFAFSHHQPNLNTLRSEDKSISLQTPILDFNQTPFFNLNQTSSASAITPGDDLNNFVAPNEILQTYTTASSTSTSTTTNANLNVSTHASLHQPQQQPDYQFTATGYGNAGQQQQQVNNQYVSSANLNHHQQQQQQQTDLVAAAAAAINHHSHLNHADQPTMTYTELKPSGQQQQQPQLLIPNSVYDIAGYKKNPPPYPSPASPASSMSSQTSSSNLDNADSMYASGAYGESNASNRSQRRFAAVGQSASESKKSRMTKKQKYDAMINEERQLTNNNNQLRADISNLELQIARYKNSIMNTVQRNKK